MVRSPPAAILVLGAPQRNNLEEILEAGTLPWRKLVHYVAGSPGERKLSMSSSSTVPRTEGGESADTGASPRPQNTQPEAADQKHPFLVALGERVRALRSRRGMTRKGLAQATGVSERHLANLEYGVGNASVLVLLEVTKALQCAFAELLGEATTSSPEWLLLRETLAKCDEATLRRVRIAVGEMLATAPRGLDALGRSPRVALIGLRGAGKTTLGRLLAEDLGFPFIELSREIERLAGCSIAEILGLYGQTAYRRYERRALEEAIQMRHEAVISTAGGMVSDLVSFNLLLRHCTTVWLKADPEDHMARVLAQGDLRPMAASAEAMEDLKMILASRSPFYAKADLSIDTSSQPLLETFQLLRSSVREALALPI